MLLTFDARALNCVVEELQLLIGGQIQRISQPDALQVVLAVYKASGGEKHLLIDVSPRFYRAHLTTTRTPKSPSPPPFCMTLRKYLGDGEITSISQRSGDRILDIRVQNNGAEYLLSAELMGKHANLILVSPDNKVLHAAKLITTKQSRVREVLPGREYSAPPAPRFQATPSETKNWQPVVLRDEHNDIIGASPVRVDGFQNEARESFSAALDEYFAFTVPRAELMQEQSTLHGAVAKTLSQKQRALSQVQRGANESTRADQYRRWGELILGSLHVVKAQLEAGEKSATVLDFYDEAGGSVTIPLDENLSAQENANFYFSRARHVEENAEELKKLESTLAREVEELEKFADRVNAASEVLALRELREQALSRGWLRSSQERSTPSSDKTAPDFDGHKIKKFSSPDGFTVLVGENATANDYLVTRLSHSNDWWLHLRGGTSSHAIIQTHNAPDRVPLSTLLFAARLVIARSVAKHAGWAEVDYTLRKYVRKPRKAAPGSVVHTNAKTLHVEPEV